MSIYFTDEHRKTREKTRKFFEQNVIPYLDRWEKDKRIPRDIWQKLGEAELLGLHHPKAYGGQELDIFHSVVFLEELGRLGYAGFRGSVSVHSYMATEYLAQAACHKLKKRYLQAAIEGRKLAALAISEPNAGSDVAQIECSAIVEDEYYIVNGAKTFVTNGLECDFYTTAVKILGDPDEDISNHSAISLLVIDANSLGLSVEELKKIGWHCSDTAQVVLKNVKVPITNLIGKEKHGFFYIMKCFQLERLAASLLALGGIDRCLEITSDYISNRSVFGKKISQHQAIQHRFADLISQLLAARQLTYHTAWMYDTGELPITECSMSKLITTELANHVSDECFQFFGGVGYLNETNISRIFRDTRLGTIVGGTSEVMRDIIASNEL